ncbi:DUF1846 domain-containing protein [bacterium]|nr:DUF1846 domain-containing protein [bacterium]
MMIGFDNQVYVTKQTEKILERINLFNNKLYLEFGGKLFDDLHAARVLPGFDPNVKTKLLQNLKDKLEVIFCISAADIERNKMRADFGITYDMDLIRLIDNLRAIGIFVSSIVITKFSEQHAALLFKNKLECRGEKVFIHRYTKGYPNDVNLIASDIGYGANPYIETTRPLVVVTAPGPGSGKLATCLSQLYHEFRRGNSAGYAKYESFPVWNLPLKHPINVAYEAATADIKDFNMIDSFHLDAYGISTVNYNRDVEIFPVVKNILTRILGPTATIYQSPTDMGVNMIGYAITNQEVVKKASVQEIIRRYYKTYCDFKQGRVELEAAHRVEILMNNIGAKPADRLVVEPAIEKSKEASKPAVAIELPDGKIITGRDRDVMTASAAVIINALKHLAGIDDQIKLISPIVIGPILKLKAINLKSNFPALTLEEALIALSITAVTNPTVEYLLTKIPLLEKSEAHSTVMIDESELQVYRKLGINITCEPQYR